MQNVLVTGANRGIGLAIVELYLQRGERVFATCRQPSAAARLIELQQQHPERLVVLPLDVPAGDRLPPAGTRWPGAPLRCSC